MTDGAQLVVPGRAILREVLAGYQGHRAELAARRTSAVIMRFDADPQRDTADWITRMRAAHISAEQKKRTFRALGVDVHDIVFHAIPSRAEFVECLAAANTDPRAAALIVQLPVPALLADELDRIDPAKDIDGLGSRTTHRACATAEGIARITHPFLSHRDQIAVVGGRGFVGSGVVALLRAAGHDTLPLDIDDDLRQVRDAAVVISATGRPGLLTTDHLHTGHALVIDAGFIPDPGGARGDVDHRATPLPRAITPVPGGVGPVEMAVLAERLLRATLAPDLPSWRYLRRAEHPVTTITTSATTQNPPARGRPTADAGRPGPGLPPRRPPTQGPRQPSRRS